MLLAAIACVVTTTISFSGRGRIAMDLSQFARLGLMLRLPTSLPGDFYSGECDQAQTLKYLFTNPAAGTEVDLGASGRFCYAPNYAESKFDKTGKLVVFEAEMQVVGSNNSCSLIKVAVLNPLQVDDPIAQVTLPLSTSVDLSEACLVAPEMVLASSSPLGRLLSSTGAEYTTGSAITSSLVFQPHSSLFVGQVDILLQTVSEYRKTRYVSVPTTCIVYVTGTVTPPTTGTAEPTTKPLNLVVENITLMVENTTLAVDVAPLSFPQGAVTAMQVEISLAKTFAGGVRIPNALDPQIRTEDASCLGLATGCQSPLALSGPAALVESALRTLQYVATLPQSNTALIKIIGVSADGSTQQQVQINVLISIVVVGEEEVPTAAPSGDEKPQETPATMATGELDLSLVGLAVSFVLLFCLVVPCIMSRTVRRMYVHALFQFTDRWCGRNPGPVILHPKPHTQDMV
ncbi:hypothetical protein BASA81_003778 [Batrachochytrium salamandrivorans]|nr:hypothetical protein BASA81_003778 [Batrachochytrium salamandrivorans]